MNLAAEIDYLAEQNTEWWNNFYFKQIGFNAYDDDIDIPDWFEEDE